MSYPLDIDEVPEDALIAEVQRRLSNRMKGYCDYCGRHHNDTPCKFPERHKAAGEFKAAIDAAKMNPASTPQTPPPQPPAIGPLTGEQLRILYAKNISSSSDTPWTALAAELWPPAPPPEPTPAERREKLRSEIVRTDHGEYVTVLELCGVVAVVQSAASGWWWYARDIRRVRELPQNEAITAAENWLIDRAMKAKPGGTVEPCGVAQ